MSDQRGTRQRGVGGGEATAAKGCRTLLVIGADPVPEREAESAGDRRPRSDYDLLRARLDADLLTPNAARADRVGRVLARRAPPLALAWAAFRRRRDYAAIFTDSERIGLPLALLLAVAGRRPKHIMLTHYLTPWKKRIWFRLGAGRGVDRLIVHASTQRALALGQLRLPEERVALLPYQADTHFWRPVPPSDALADDAPLICAAGLEFRDYATLLAAVAELEVRLRIAAASHWSHHAAFAGSVTLPANASVASLGYPELRQLYAASRFVVVPLLDVDNQAGITTLLEAMAMGKAVVVSATRGQRDVVRGYPFGDRTLWRPALLDRPHDAPGAEAEVGELPTGIYVTPGDPADLRRAITFLLEHPEIAEELGRNGRRVAEEYFSVEGFAARVAATIQPSDYGRESDI